MPKVIIIFNKLLLILQYYLPVIYCISLPSLTNFEVSSDESFCIFKLPLKIKNNLFIKKINLIEFKIYKYNKYI